MDRIIRSSFLLIFISCSAWGQGAFFGDREKGWFWYEKPIEKEEPAKDQKLKEEKNISSTNSQLSPREIIKKQGEDWENSLSKAMLDPNKDNVLSYIQTTQKINQQAQVFSDAFKEAIWITPQYDMSLKSPNNPEAIVAKNEELNKDTDRTIQKIAKSYGIIFYFDDSCPVCHRFSPILKKFEDYYHLNVLPTSSTGKGTAEYPHPQRNLNFSSKINTKYFPSTYLVEPESGKITPISYGYADWSTLQAKIVAAHERLNNEHH